MTGIEENSLMPDEAVGISVSLLVGRPELRLKTDDEAIALEIVERAAVSAVKPQGRAGTGTGTTIGKRAQRALKERDHAQRALATLDDGHQQGGAHRAEQNEAINQTDQPAINKRASQHR